MVIVDDNEIVETPGMDLSDEALQVGNVQVELLRDRGNRGIHELFGKKASDVDNEGRSAENRDVAIRCRDGGRTGFEVDFRADKLDLEALKPQMFTIYAKARIVLKDLDLEVPKFLGREGGYVTADTHADL